MKSVFRSIVLAAAILAAAGVHYASAQIENKIAFTTSFPFTVGNATLPAGSYTIAPVADDDPQVLELKGERTSVLFVTESAAPHQMPSKTEVVFKRYGDGYLLKNIFLEGSDVGYVTANALAERKLAKRGGSPTEHHVAARKTVNTAK